MNVFFPHESSIALLREVRQAGNWTWPVAGPHVSVVADHLEDAIADNKQLRLELEEVRNEIDRLRNQLVDVIGRNANERFADVLDALGDQ